MLEVKMETKINVAENDVKKVLWNLDKTHSKLQFSARHMIIAEVAGHFNNFDVTIKADDDFLESEAEVTIDVKSIDTGITDRDNHLKSPDFFDVENYPQITFKSKKVEKVDDETFKLYGDFTIRNITRPLVLDVTYGGTIKDPWGFTRAGFKIQGKINRFDYDLKWNAFMETGGAVVGKNINITCDIELTKAQ
jgi:polyisoprenoid-binding protein YceI